MCIARVLACCYANSSSPAQCPSYQQEDYQQEQDGHQNFSGQNDFGRSPGDGRNDDLMGSRTRGLVNSGIFVGKMREPPGGQPEEGSDNEGSTCRESGDQPLVDDSQGSQCLQYIPQNTRIEATTNQQGH